MPPRGPGALLRRVAQRRRAGQGSLRGTAPSGRPASPARSSVGSPGGCGEASCSCRAWSSPASGPVAAPARTPSPPERHRSTRTTQQHHEHDHVRTIQHHLEKSSEMNYYATEQMQQAYMAERMGEARAARRGRQARPLAGCRVAPSAPRRWLAWLSRGACDPDRTGLPSGQPACRTRPALMTLARRSSGPVLFRRTDPACDPGSGAARVYGGAVSEARRHLRPLRRGRARGPAAADLDGRRSSAAGCSASATAAPASTCGRWRASSTASSW